MNDRTRDLICWVIDRMMAHDDSITQELALTVEREARMEWGGQTIQYIAKNCVADRPSPATVVRDYARDPRPDVVAKRHGISRATLYRMLRER